MSRTLKKPADSLSGAVRQINLGLTVQFQNAEYIDDRLQAAVGYTYSGTQGLISAEAIEIRPADGTSEDIFYEVSLLAMHVIDTDYPFVNTVVAFDEYTGALPAEDGHTYFRDGQNYIQAEGAKLFAAGSKYICSRELTEVSLLEYIRKTIVFSYEFGLHLQTLIHKRPRPVKDSQVSEDIRYLIIQEGLQRANSIGDKQLFEKDHSWDIMNSFRITDNTGKTVDEAPGILSFRRDTDEMSVEVLIQPKRTIPIEVYQQGAMQLAIQAGVESIDYADEYRSDEEGTYFTFCYHFRYGYDAARIETCINRTAQAAANLILKIR